MAERTTKTLQIKNYLIENRKITQVVAWDKFHAQRLASIIFNLRKRGMEIHSRDCVTTDCNGNPCRYTEYIYTGE